MSPYIGRNFEEVKAILDEKGEKYSWEIARPKSRAFDIDETDLYCLREQESSQSERKLVLAYAAKTKGGTKDGI
ncbi:MAG: hypothetical protein J6M62_03155 [Selenomonadaceae bacterium]|nr:hypothetical protein [Selenomonadaceae bacterium]MBP3723604.1 hypothetical protein [Selenomonadaceae bacterium]